MEPYVAPGEAYPNSGPLRGPASRPVKTTLRLEYGAGSAAPEEITMVLDSTHKTRSWVKPTIWLLSPPIPWASPST